MDDIMDAVHAVRNNVGSRIAKVLSPSSRRQSGPSSQGTKLQSEAVVPNAGRAPSLQVFDRAEVRGKSNTSFWDAPSGLGETKGEAEQQTMDPQVEDLHGMGASSLPSGPEPCTHDVKKAGEKKPRMATGPSLSQRVERFMEHAAELTTGLLKREEGPGESAPCSRCNDSPQVTLYRCTQCFSPPVLCRRHIVEDHLHNPLHVVEEWYSERKFWKRVPLSDLGLVVNLGHGGDACRHCLWEPRTMTIVHDHGVHTVKMRFCGCWRDDGQRVPEPIQLVEAGFWPTSMDRPMSAIAIQTLRSFALLSPGANTTAQDFCKYLRRLTDNTCADQVSDQYKNFLVAVHVFGVLTLRKRLGKQADTPIHHADLAVLCPACPQPDINMDPAWRTRPAAERFVDALFHAVDGNFRQNRKAKRSDPDDVALTDGAAYFAPAATIKKIVKALGPPKHERSTCNKFGAMGYFGHNGAVSGMVSVSCARHMFVMAGGGVDLVKGERYAYVDLAQACALQGYMTLYMQVSAYDINCQHRKNLAQRMKELDEIAQKLEIRDFKMTYFPRTTAGVGKFHLPSHKQECQYKYAFQLLPGVGQTDGEASERIWSNTNQVAPRAREMAEGHRLDTLNLHYSDMNVQRTHGLAKYLAGRYITAMEECEHTHAYVEKLGEQVIAQWDSETLAEWRQAEQRYIQGVVDMKNHDELENPYEIRKEKRLTRAQAMAQLTVKACKLQGFSDGLVGAVEEAIDLQETKAQILFELGLGEASDVSEADMTERCDAFFKRADDWREKAGIYLTPLVDEAAKSMNASALVVAAQALLTEATRGLELTGSDS
ncbi:hypothetical protein NM688_g8797 [Phlebia brevispora]|uniref:Uncharacterized protein n=1 Tax=Phlebia brevispora TaxID=194682 RepID=A0ACC1RRE9_9APHY|nr:hypothetical protein NM688_g8797 [Phlebia brevispora]